MLQVMLGAIATEYDLSNWNIYQDKSNALIVKLCDIVSTMHDGSVVTNTSYKRKTPSQVELDGKHHLQSAERRQTAILIVTWWDIHKMDELTSPTDDLECEDVNPMSGISTQP